MSALGRERADGERVARVLGLEPLPDEGGLFRQTFADAHSSAIYYLLLAPDFSALHVLSAAETYHWYGGSPLRLLLLHDDGRVDEPILGPDLVQPALVQPYRTTRHLEQSRDAVQRSGFATTRWTK